MALLLVIILQLPIHLVQLHSTVTLKLPQQDLRQDLPFAQTAANETGTVDGTSFAEPAQFENLTFPFVSTLTLNFNPNLTDDTDAIFRVFFTNDDAGDNTGRDFGTKDALLVQDSTPANISGTVSASSLQFSYAYDSNVQRGNASSGVDVPITVVAIGANTAQYVISGRYNPARRLDCISCCTAREKLC